MDCGLLQVRNTFFLEESAMHCGMLSGYPEMTYVANNQQYQDDGRKMDDASPSRTYGNLFRETSTCLPWINRNSQAHLEIIEEPLSDGIKFRYEKEGRSSSRILGESSTKGYKTFPAIKIHGYEGAAYLVISLVSVEPPYYPHPHKIVGEACEGGVYYRQIYCNPEMICRFSDLRIQCVKRNDVMESLAEREASRVDPFGTGFLHANEPKKINYNAIRLCFQIFLPDSNGKFRIPAAPVVSTPIGNKTVCDLAIMKLSHCSAPASGDKEVILLCGQVQKDDIEVVFYEENENKETKWFAKVDVSPDDVHRNSAISFKTPAYVNPNIQRQVKCFIFLRRPSDGIVGRPREFTLYPSKRDLDIEAIADKCMKAQDLDLCTILQMGNFDSQSFGVVNQVHAYNIPVNQLNSPARATAMKRKCNCGNASASYSKQPDSLADTEWPATQPEAQENQSSVNPVDDQIISLSGNLSDMTIDPITDDNGLTSVGLNHVKIANEQNQFQDKMRKKVEDVGSLVDNTYQRDIPSNESDGNLSGMTIDSLTEIDGLISVGLIA